MLLWTLVSMCRFSNSCFFFLWIHTYIYIYAPRSGIAGPRRGSVFSYSNSLHNASCRCTSLHSYQQCKGFPFLCIFTDVCYLRCVWWQHSDRCEVLSRCFNVFFSDDSWFWTSLHVYVGHLYVFFGKMSVQVFCSLITGFFVLLILNFVSCLYILAFNP